MFSKQTPHSGLPVLMLPASGVPVTELWETRDAGQLREVQVELHSVSTRDVSATQGRVDARQSESSAVSHRPHPRGARSKVIAEQPVVGLKKDYIYIRDRQLFWFGDGRYLHLMPNGILHFQHKALEATKWIFDLGLSPHYTTERLEKLKTLFFFFTEALCSMKVLKNTTIAFNMTNVAAWRSVIMVWFSWINNLPPTEATTLLSLFWELCFAQQHVEMIELVVGSQSVCLWCCPLPKEKN